jgi:hypothetical protein
MNTKWKKTLAIRTLELIILGGLFMVLITQSGADTLKVGSDVG